MPYAKINPSACEIRKDRIKLRLDLFLSPTDPNYDKHHLYIPDWDSAEAQAGYQGELDADGTPIDENDYQQWVDSLPHIWVDNSFHSHMIHPLHTASDDEIRAEILTCFNYFYTFHQHCWDTKLEFINEWKKVPLKDNEVRHRFVAGEAKDKNKNEKRLQDILSRVDDFAVGIAQVGESVDLRIGEKGTIDVGTPAINRGSAAYLCNTVPFPTYYTRVEVSNPANDTGTIDTVEAWFVLAAGGNSVKYGTFEHLGSNELKCHDAEEYGEVSAGSKQTCSGLSIAISSGEYIGVDARAAANLSIEYDASGGEDMWYKMGLFCDPNDQETFTWMGGDIISLYGTGTTGAPPTFTPKNIGII